MSRPSAPGVRELPAPDARQLEALAALLVDCVQGGASVSFLAPLAPGKALAFWREVAAEARAGRRVLLVAEDGEGIAGTVQVLLEQPENQPHRADVAKMLVLRRARRQGLGAALLLAAEQAARARGKTLLVLDTANPEAERLYARLGWQRSGSIPGYALLPDGRPCDTVIYYRQLGSSGSEG
jgi:GNAT superfamily N-acetyltransferase